jgi:hypothetical protein
VPWAVVGAVGGALITANAAGDAASTQAGAAQAGVGEQRREFDYVQNLLAPFINAAVGSGGSSGGSTTTTTYQAPTSYPQQWSGGAGNSVDLSWQSDPSLRSASDPNWHPPTYYNPNYNPADASTYTGIPTSAFNKPSDVGVPQQVTTQASAGGQGGSSIGALPAYLNLIGLNGDAAQQAALASLQTSPQFTNLVQQGENAILQNASATGGLRGGNVQGALSNFRGNALSSLIDQQLSRYGGIIQLGQSSAAGVGNAALSTGNNISNLLQQAGAAQAGGTVAGASAITSALGNVGGFLASRGYQPASTVPAVSYTNPSQYSPYGASYGLQPSGAF